MVNDKNYTIINLLPYTCKCIYISSVTPLYPETLFGAIVVKVTRSRHIPVTLLTFSIS